MAKNIKNLTNSPYEIDLKDGTKAIVPAFGTIENIEPGDNLSMMWEGFFEVTDYEEPVKEAPKEAKK